MTLSRRDKPLLASSLAAGIGPAGLIAAVCRGLQVAGFLVDGA